MIQSQDLETLREYETFFSFIHPPEENNNDAFIWISRMSHPLFNAIIHLRNTTKEAVQLLINQYSSTAPLSLWNHKFNDLSAREVFLENGYNAVPGKYPIMTWSVEESATPEHSSEKASEESFSKIIRSVFQQTPELNKLYIEALRKLPNAENYEISIDGKPTTTGTLAFQTKTGAIFNIATLERHRRKGYAKSMMLHLMKRAHTLGIEKILLMGTPESEKLYSELGFKKSLDITLYVLS